MEKFLNFYITIMAGFSTAKSDSFYLRFFQPQLIREITSNMITPPKNNDSVIFWEKYHNLYMTTTQYYKNIYDGIKRNQKKILLQYDLSADEKRLQGNHFLLLQENFVATILQEINPRSNKLYIKNEKVLAVFQEYFLEKIQEIVQTTDKNKQITLFYDDLTALLHYPEHFLSPISHYFTDTHIFNIREQIYTVDYWIWRMFLSQLKKTRITQCDDPVIMGISALLRETIF